MGKRYAMTEPRTIAQCVAATRHSYQVAGNGNSITFHPCGTISYSPSDVTNRYCGKCHRFIGDIMKLEDMLSVDKDDYDEVINGKRTYQFIATQLNSGDAVVIGWTDELATHYDILWVLGAHREGNLQGGLDGHELFVSIMRKGAFGFDADRSLLGPLHPEYVGEKLYVSGVAAQKLAELINGVLGALGDLEP